jgi:DNA-directed RNA polymerase specialized sigma24 family protein
MDLAIEPLRWSGLEELRPSLQRLLARRCRDAAELDDVVQETLLRAARYRAKLSERERLRGWAMRIAINVLRDRVRRRERWSGTES